MIINFYDGGPAECTIIFPEWSFSDEQPRQVPLIEEFFVGGQGGGATTVLLDASDFFEN